MAACPWTAATINGVMPVSSFALTSAPAVMQILDGFRLTVEQPRQATPARFGPAPLRSAPSSSSDTIACRWPRMRMPSSRHAPFSCAAGIASIF